MNSRLNIKIFRLLSFVVMFVPVLFVHVEDTISQTQSPITIAPSQSTSLTITQISAGDSLKLDLSKFSSQSITVTLIDTSNQSEELQRVPLLTDSIGFPVAIPEDTITGRYNLHITGVEKGEQIILPLEIEGVSATASSSTSRPTLGFILLISLLLLGIIAYVIRIIMAHRKHPVITN